MICCCSFSFSIRRGVTRSSEPVTTDSSLTAFSPSSWASKVILLSSTACILFSVTTEGRDRIFALEFCCSALSRTRKLGVSLNIVLNMPMPSFFAGLLLKQSGEKRGHGHVQHDIERYAELSGAAQCAATEFQSKNSIAPLGGDAEQYAGGAGEQYYFLYQTGGRKGGQTGIGRDRFAAARDAAPD